MKDKENVKNRFTSELIRYANCWEDAALLIESLNINRESVCLSIASAGDNTLALLTQNPRLVLAADLSGAQLACLELRMAAFSKLSYEELLGFLGVRTADNRLSVYGLLRPELTRDSRDFWDRLPAVVDKGIIFHGRFENYFRVFRRYILPLMHSQKTVQELLLPKPLQERQHFYEQKWANLRWRTLFRLFFGRTVMGRLGRDPQFFRHVQGSVSERILARTKAALTTLPAEDNPYLQYILTGAFQEALPLYLQPQHYETIRNNLHSLRLFQGPAEQAPAHFGVQIDAFNLSDIFEYMDREQFAAVAAQLVKSARPGCRFAYWNMLVHRNISELASEIRCLEELSAELFLQDRAFFYSAFFVEERL